MNDAPDTYPDRIENVDQLEELLSRPPDYLVEIFERTPGDVIVLGVAGKMGMTLARMAKRAADAAGSKRKIIGVARFSKPDQQPALEMHGVDTIRADLLHEKQLDSLPDAPNVVYMPAMKFGATGQEALTWAMNTFLAGMCARRYRNSKIVAFSTGNVYGLNPVVLGGALETSELDPRGDYAMSCLGRERMFEYFSRLNGTPTALIRLNYSTEMRYGVLVDVAQKVFAGEEIDLSMGAFNAIWQGDANAMSLACLGHVATPPFVLNVAGPELLSLRRCAETFAAMMKKPLKTRGVEAADALISNGQLGHRLFGYPRVPIEQLMTWIAHWVTSGGASLGKPTHFEARDGKY
jgi:nucleoside-diphosphate-sugar epimerase